MNDVLVLANELFGPLDTEGQIYLASEALDLVELFRRNPDVLYFTIFRSRYPLTIDREQGTRIWIYPDIKDFKISEVGLTCYRLMKNNGLPFMKILEIQELMK